MPTTILTSTPARSPAQEGRLDLKGLLPDQLIDYVSELGEKEYRGRQLWSWIHEKGESDIAMMSDLPASFRRHLADVAYVSALSERERQQSATGKAAKFLFEIPDGGRVEAVYISDGSRRTACLSSQVGCALDCRFCATAKMGFLRNLTSAQIVDQLLQLQRFASALKERVTNVVMMGMGEPLLNYDHVVAAFHLMRSGANGIGGRRITVSTAGYVPGIRRLSREDLNVGLAISLNATTDEVRSRIMPINRKYPIATLLEAGQEYFDRRGRRVTFEYVLMAGVTDGDDDARRLAQLARQLPCKINLIPYNEPAAQPETSPGELFHRPSEARVKRFTRVLKAETSRTVTVRDSRGRDIDAACGQLYHRVEKRAAASDGHRRQIPQSQPETERGSAHTARGSDPTA